MLKEIAIGGASFMAGVIVKGMLPVQPPMVHAELIAQCSVTNTTRGWALDPICISVNPISSVWAWVSPETHDIEMLSVVSDFEYEGVQMIGIEFSRSGWNAFDIVAKDKTGSFPAVTEFPALGYWGFDWPK